MDTIRMNTQQLAAGGAKALIAGQRRMFDGLDRKWKRFDSKQAEYAPAIINEHGGSNIWLFKSYDTIVGFVYEDVFYELGKYSPTTSKQITQFCNRFGFDREFVDGSDFDNYWPRETYPQTKAR